MNNAYAAWLAEDKLTSELTKSVFTKMSLEEFKASRMMRVMTPEKAITTLEKMLTRAPVEHFVIQVPPGMPLSKFVPYAELFAREVIPSFL
jgi:hypothetical protein